jgi:membrane-bound metal-dependent hydrolase YbcI (DUF457 family)
MFVGHFAVALGAKRAAPRIPLGLLVGAGIALDLLWPLFLLAGLETVRIDPGNTAFTPAAFDHYPWSHSLLMAVVWGGLLALVAMPRLRSAADAAVVGAVVVSHWVLDYVTHRPDMPLWPGSAKFGLGLWNSIPATFIVEGTMFAAAVYLYQSAFPARDRTGRWALVGLVVFTSVIWAIGPWSPPPADVHAIAYVGLATWLFPIWARWIERHRYSRPSGSR